MRRKTNYNRMRKIIQKILKDTNKIYNRDSKKIMQQYIVGKKYISRN